MSKNKIMLIDLVLKFELMLPEDQMSCISEIFLGSDITLLSMSQLSGSNCPMLFLRNFHVTFKTNIDPSLFPCEKTETGGIF